MAASWTLASKASAPHSPRSYVPDLTMLYQKQKLHSDNSYEEVHDLKQMEIYNEVVVACLKVCPFARIDRKNTEFPQNFPTPQRFEYRTKGNSGE